MAETWWEDFFDTDYVHLWGGFVSKERTLEEAAGIWSLLQLRAGSRLLDAPCGYGRLSVALARRGARVVGVDQSQSLLRFAKRDRGNLSNERLRYVRHDLRFPLPDGDEQFEAAINVFSSIGYGTDDEDLAILRTLRAAVRPGGLVLVETMHRDAVAARVSRGVRPAQRLPDGTLILEEPTFDALAGRVVTRWFWSGARGSGQKAASLRVYTATELVRLVERAGLRFRSAHRGCSAEPFEAQGADMGGRLAILAERI